MKTRIFADKKLLGEVAGAHAAAAVRQAITARGRARIIAATGVSQFEFLAALVQSAGVDWSKVEMFHLDEYVGLPESHPASFRRYLRERLITPTGIGRYHLLDGEKDPEAICEAIGRELNAVPVDVAFVGIGENGHLAFNDPPADFETEKPYLVVDLDETCRRQQVGEGWFSDISEVPKQAISMSIRQILKAREILCIVPDARKARAVKACLEGEVRRLAPASVLRTHANTTLFLDRNSSALLSERIAAATLSE